MSNHDREGSHPSNRDATLERAWREASDEQPPAHLDAAIVAAARNSVGNRSDQRATTASARARSPSRLTQWQPLAVAATVAGLAFVLVQMLPREQSLAPATQRQESAPVATDAQPPAKGSSAGEAVETREAINHREAPRSDKTLGASERVGVAGRAPEQDAVPGPLTAPASPAEPSARDLNRGNAAPLEAAAWAARVATLHASGDATAAEQELRAFRAAEPDADSYLPESLRHWAQTVK